MNSSLRPDEAKTSSEKTFLKKVTSNPFLLYLPLFFVPLLVFFEVYTFHFSKDDFFSVLPLPGLDQLSSIPGYFVSPVQFLDAETGTLKNLHYYRPIATSTLTLDFFLFGKENPGILHLENLFLHILNGFVLFFLFSCLTSRQTAFLGALCYSIFPMSTEMISIYHYRVDLLCTFFIFLTLYLAVSRKENWWSYPVAAFFFLAMLSKEIAIILLVMIPLLRYHRFSFPSLREIIVILIIPMLCYWSLRYFALGDFITPQDEYNLDIFTEHNVAFLEKLNVIVDSFGQKSFWIFSPLSIQPVIYANIEGSHDFAIPGIVLLVVLVISSLLYFKTKSLIHLASIGVLVTWFPLSSILVATPDFSSARMFYHPAPWILLLVLLIIQSIPLQLLRITIISSLLLAWGTSSYLQKHWYKNNLSGMLAITEYYPDNPYANKSIGRMLLADGRHEESYPYSIKAYKLLISQYESIEIAGSENPKDTSEILEQLQKHAEWRGQTEEANNIATMIDQLQVKGKGKNLDKATNDFGE